jgi:hypothetical protein
MPSCSEQHAPSRAKSWPTDIVLATGWENTELRSFHFVDPTGEDPNASIKETPESWQQRRGKTAPPTEAEQRELRAVYYQQMGPILKYQEREL